MLSAADYPQTEKVRDALSDAVIGCAIEVHRSLGPGLLESAYCDCLAHELSLAKLAFQREVALPLKYKGITLATSYRLDFLIEDQLVLEIKAVDRLEDIHEAQLLTYLRLSGRKTGLLLNFNDRYLKNGILRRIL
jgi:GxxExxY protein